jgi:hypothetical protein
VTIKPGPGRSDDDKKVLRGFNATCTPSGFEEVIKTAAQAMGILNEPSGTMSEFAEDILCVTIRGPRCQRISIIDIPGLIAANKGNQNDIQVVESITDTYIKDELTVILAVVNADANTNDHAILEKARRVDPNGERTFGIITKPDKVEAGLPSETNWLNLALQNKDAFFPFRQGCHVMVNRNGQDTVDGTAPDDRDRNEEQFFAAKNWAANAGQNAEKPNRWNQLYHTNQWGIKHLRPRLTTLLYRHTQKQMKSLREDINERIANYDAEVDRLNLGLLEPAALRELISEKCESMLLTASEGVYGTNRDPDFFSVAEFESENGPARFLRGRIREENKKFHDKIMKTGHRAEYGWGPDKAPPESVEQVTKFHRFLINTIGTELPGNLDPHRLTPLFVDYSKPWQGIAESYLNRAFDHASIFATLIVNIKFGKGLPNVVERYHLHVLSARLNARRLEAIAELKKIEMDRQGNVITEDRRFLEESFKRSTLRSSRKLSNAEVKDGVLNTTAEKTAVALVLGGPESKVQEAAMQMFEEMLIYYRVSKSLPELWLQNKAVELRTC